MDEKRRSLFTDSPKTRAMLERGIGLFRNGLRYEQERERASQRGYRAPNQVIVDRAEGDFIWDLDGKRYIDFQNGWATNPIGNAHPEIIDAVDAAHRRYGFHYDHPLRYDLAEKLAGIMPGRAMGMMMRANAPHTPCPSTSAASSSSEGMDMNWSRMIQMTMGSTISV